MDPAGSVDPVHLSDHDRMATALGLSPLDELPTKGGDRAKNSACVEDLRKTPSSAFRSWPVSSGDVVTDDHDTPGQAFDQIPCPAENTGSPFVSSRSASVA